MGGKVKTIYTGDEAANVQKMNADLASELLKSWVKRQQVVGLQNQQAKALEDKQVANTEASLNARTAATLAKQKATTDAAAASRATAATQTGGLAPVTASGWPKAPMTAPVARPKPLRARLFQ